MRASAVSMRLALFLVSVASLAASLADGVTPQIYSEEQQPLTASRFGSTTVPAFPLARTDNHSVCRLDLSDELFGGVGDACVRGGLDRSRCCPVLAAWLFAAHARSALEIRPSPAAEDGLGGPDGPMMPDDNQKCVDSLQSALERRDIRLPRPNATCDTVLCYCGIRLHQIGSLRCPTSFNVSGGATAARNVTPTASVRQLERECRNASYAGCNRCLHSLDKLKENGGGVGGDNGDRATKMLGRDCQLMGLTWLLARNKTAYIPTVSAVLRAVLYSAHPPQADGSGGGSGYKCSPDQENMPLAVDSLQFPHQPDSAATATSRSASPSALVLSFIVLPILLLASLPLLMSQQAETGEAIRNEGKYMAIIVCWLLGNGCLFSWNSMLMIEDYYVYLFPSYHPTRVLALVYQPFALGTIAILAYHEAKINTRRRNLAGYSLFFLSSLALIVLDVATSGKGGIGVFIGVCVVSGAFGVADAHVQGGMVGDLSLMSPELIQSFLAGLAASGALTSALRLITKAAFENSQDGLRKGAMMFFAISCFFELLCVLLYAIVFPKLPIVKFYRAKAASEGSMTVSADLAAGGIQTHHAQGVEEDPKLKERMNNRQLLLENIDYALDMFLIYVLTLSIFPGFLSEDTGSHSLGSWYALVLFAMYNVWDLIGRYIPLLKRFKLASRKGLMAAILSRFILIPAFYFTAKYGDQGWMILLTSFLGLSNGYLTVCVLTAAPKGYKGPEQNALGNLLVLCLLAGIFAGVTLDWLWLIGKGW
ncbi:equilibrative nucleoside transporter [Musa troglodytarum]|uniref:Equilibrative nucleoside transporter n=1 Tax=Musa troglodytarum TaxID=320322 RepID=A0A9E7HEQ9_9LILI|nr:equilibrative nucleoside transporter [Musa troglodytarum]